MMSYIHDRLSKPEEIALAQLCSRELTAFLKTKAEIHALHLTDDEGVALGVDIPMSALRLLVEVLTQLGQGNAIHLIPVHTQLTTQEGADMLNISRPSFIKLLDDGLIPHHRVGNRRKVAYSDVLAYKQNMDTKRLDTLDELSKLDQSMDMGY